MVVTVRFSSRVACTFLLLFNCQAYLVPKNLQCQRQPKVVSSTRNSLCLSAKEGTVTTGGPTNFWVNAWDDIQNGGNKRWIVDDVSLKQKALGHITRNFSKKDNRLTSLSIFCPLAGDDTFLYHAWDQGHSVVGIDLVPAAVSAMRKQFGPDDTDWTRHDSDGSMVVWKHNSGRVTLINADAFTMMNELVGSFDAVYDKDSFGAIPQDLRSNYCKLIAAYLKTDGVIYCEAVTKSDSCSHRHEGPPYHIGQDELMDPQNYGEQFNYVEILGVVYDIQDEEMDQVGHILKRK